MGGVELTASLDTAASPEVLFAWLEDLSRYPQWLSIVAKVEPSGTDAWLVDLRGRLGPFARSKRLRMVRTVHEPFERVVFERHELDDRDHGSWVLDAHVHPAGNGGSSMAIELRYSGGLWAPVLERLVNEEVQRSGPRLKALVEAPAG
ncbi:MAG: hypothetical protein JWL70_343 [Acidimicrobiia bacterium]|nr:hypothetical protein [Acidimicrobiia bacterium]